MFPRSLIIASPRLSVCRGCSKKQRPFVVVPATICKMEWSSSRCFLLGDAAGWNGTMRIFFCCQAPAICRQFQFSFLRKSLSLSLSLYSRPAVALRWIYQKRRGATEKIINLPLPIDEMLINRVSGALHKHKQTEGFLAGKKSRETDSNSDSY